MSAAFYVLSAIEGRSLGDLDAFVPPAPYPYKNKPEVKQPVHQPGNAPGGGAAIVTDIGTPKKPLKNFEEAIKLATQQNKPIFIDFTGFNCVNCRLMEKSTLIAPEVLAQLENYVYVELYTDRPDAEYKANQDLEQKLMQTTALPEYAAVSSDGKTLLARSDGLTRNVPEYVEFLKSGLAKNSASGPSASQAAILERREIH